jgi:hypothetical protein
MVTYILWNTVGDYLTYEQEYGIDMQTQILKGPNRMVWAETHNRVVGKDLTSNTSNWNDSNMLNH